jgi:3-oxoacyl-[acyl-carrier protein] reductase
MDLGLSQKVAVISGSSRGLGRAIAESFLHEGAFVVITGRKKSDLARTQKELSHIAGRHALMSFAGDLTQASPIQRCLGLATKRFKRLDILVANLGSGRGELGWKTSDKIWDHLMDLNLLGPMRLVRAALPLMGKGGSIVLISSIAGYEAVGGPYAYGAAKAGLLHSAKQLARELAGQKIRVNAVTPGNILFPGGSWDEKLKKNRSKVMSYIRGVVPMQRFATPEEIADVVTFVASSRARYMTGACVVVDGGQTHSI